MDPKQLARDWIETVWNQKNPGAIKERMAPFVTGVTEAAPITGPDQFRTVLYEPLVQAFPDLHIAIDGIVAEGSEAVVRWTGTGTHSGPFAHLEASGKRVKFSGMTWLRFEDGKIVEGGDSFNLHGLVGLLAGGLDTARVHLI